jgi:hypothetical protein
MNRSKSGVRGVSQWILVSVVAGAIGACVSSSSGGGGNTNFDSGMDDATFSSDGGDGSSSDATSGSNLAGCLVGLGTTLGGGDAGACGTLFECMASHCGSQLTSCFGSDYAAGIATGSVCSGFSTCAQASACTVAGG